MKKSFLICLFIACASVTKPQNTSADDAQAITMLRTFYTSYMTEMASSNQLESSEKKMQALTKKYCTAHLLNSIAKRSDPEKSDWLDYDPFIKAQDSNMDCVKNLSFKKNPHEPNLYTVSYFYIDDMSKKKETTIINVFVIKQKDGLKISSLYLDTGNSYRNRI